MSDIPSVSATVEDNISNRYLTFTLGQTIYGLELFRVVGFQPVADFAGRVLPFYTYGLGWVIPASFGFAVGVSLERKSRK